MSEQLSEQHHRAGAELAAQRRFEQGFEGEHPHGLDRTEPRAERAPRVTAPADPATAWVAEWTQALTRVEVDVHAAEELLERLHAGADVPEEPVQAWRPPSLTGPVPPPLAERARILLQRQLDVGQRLAEAMVHARAERKALSKLEPPQARPVFVDTAL